MELENFLDYRAPDWGDKQGSSWKHQLELEYGITGHWDMGLYQVFSQSNSSGFKYEEMKIETRYRLSESGLWAVNPLIYLEYKRPANASEPNELEGKLILARDFNRFNAAGNFVIEKKLISGSEWETEYALGANYHLVPSLKTGIEVIGNFESAQNNEALLGPTVSFAAEKFFLAAGALWGLNKQSDDFRLRYILGIEL